jgi:dienelactone hydrolase
MREKLRARWGRIAGWTKVKWAELRPGAEAARGARWSARLLVLAMAVYAGSHIRAGLSTTGDIAAVTVAAQLALLIGAGLLWLALWLIQKLPRFTLALMAVSVALTAYGGRGPLMPLAAVLLMSGAGACVASLIWARMSRLRLIVTWVLLGLSLCGAGTLAFLFLWDGRDKDLADAPISKQPKVEPLNAPDPSVHGPFKVISFTYGAGTDRNRPEYGAQVTLKSRTVDGSKVVKNREGWQGKVLKWQWGFDSKHLPLNARTWMPEGAGPFPIALVVHGNHQGQEYSDPGYAYLGELLASRGFILVSVDENFLNGHWTGDYSGSETAARGWLLLEHLKLWREWGKTKGHRLEGKADLTRVAIMGHSRGGEAAATAALFNGLAALPGDARQKFNYGFGIRAVVAIAPADGQYKPAGVSRPLKDVNYFVIQGGNDFDVTFFAGSRQYGRVTFSPCFSGFKSELWIYRAN